MDKHFVREALLPVIRLAFGLEQSKSITLSDEDYAQLLQVGKRQSLSPVIWNGLKKTNISIDQLKPFDSSRLKDTHDYIIRNHFYAAICDTLERTEISYIPLKGSVIKDLYPEPWMRTSCDIDILVHEEDLESAIFAIETDTDFVAGKRGLHDVSMINKNVHWLC